MATTIASQVDYKLQVGEQNLVLTETSVTEDFEAFSLGPINNGDNGWVNAGGVDQEVVDVGGNQMFRMSSDPASGAFGGPYSVALPGTAGESTTTADFTNESISFTFQAVNPAGDDSRLEVDFGLDNATDRNNFMAIESIAGDGIRIAVNEPSTDGVNWTNNDFSAFTGNRELTSGVDSSVSHTIEMRLAYVDGQDNDEIQIFLDGTLIGTTTTFENYRDFHVGPDDHAANAELNQTSRLFFRANDGGAAPQDGDGGDNQGFFFDDIANVGYNDTTGIGNQIGNVILGNRGDNSLVGLQGNDTLDGGAGDDSLSGNNGNDVLKGGDGNDSLFGGGDKDRLSGGAGDDTLIGGKGRDKLRGDAGDDTFDFNSIKDSRTGGHNRDKIQDFDHSNDVIDLSDIDAKTGGGNQKFKWIGTHDFHDRKGELHYVDKGNKVIVQGDVNGDGKADFEIFVKIGALHDDDFVL